MKPEELRNTLSTQLDKAAAGDVITIVRGGLKFTLRAEFPTTKTYTTVTGITPLGNSTPIRNSLPSSAGTHPKKEKIG